MTNLTSTPVPVVETLTPPVAETIAAPVVETVTAPAVENWADQSAKLKAKYTTLNDADLKYDEGKRDEMLNRVQIKLGKTRDELAAIIAAL